jgi:hypothetical protein
MLEAVTGAIGEADHEIGGFTLTRLTAAVSPTTALAAVYTWNGTTTVTTSDTSEVEIGDWISLDLDGQLYQVVNVTLNTSVEIVNPVGYTIPTGATQSSKSTRNLPVESVLDWDDEGKVGIDGVAYRYTDRTDTELQGITHIRGGDLVVGVKKIHTIEAPVMDLNRSRSAIDQLRRAILVAYASGEDLNAIGRNLGVERFPFLGSDDIFRAIIQALAYNPKGTVFGLELALDAMVGAGNYEIIEDLITDPCTVFIRLTGAVVTDEISHGKTYLTGPELQPPTSDTTVDINDPIVSRGWVGGVRWKDEDLLTDCRLAYPSADIITEYPGDTPHAAWDFTGSGAVEGVDVTLTGTAIEFTTTPPVNFCNYRRRLRLQPNAYAFNSLLATIPSGAPVTAPTIYTIWYLDDGVYRGSIGFQTDTVSTFRVGFITTGNVFVGSGISLNRDQFYDLAIVKRTVDSWELYIDGALAETVAYAGSLATIGSPRVTFGHFAGGASIRLQVKQVSVWSHTVTDYWAAHGVGSVNAANPTRLTSTVSVFASGDVGKTIEVYNASTPINNGRYLVDSFVDGQNVELAGPVESDLQAQYNANVKWVRALGAGRLFQYPDDVGKELVISGSTAGNNGTYVIAALYQEGTLVDLNSGDTPIPEKTSIAEVVAASFVPETGLNWQVNPDFATESPIDWELSDAGSVAGTTLTLRQALPLTAAQCYRVLEVLYSNVLSAQLLRDVLIQNEVIDTDPDLLFSYYPFYLADPLGYIRAYLDTITAAGVIPELLVD